MAPTSRARSPARWWMGTRALARALHTLLACYSTMWSMHLGGPNRPWIGCSPRPSPKVRSSTRTVGGMIPRPTPCAVRNSIYGIARCRGLWPSSRRATARVDSTSPPMRATSSRSVVRFTMIRTTSMLPLRTARPRRICAETSSSPPRLESCPLRPMVTSPHSMMTCEAVQAPACRPRWPPQSRR